MKNGKPLIGIVGKLVDKNYYGWKIFDVSDEVRKSLYRNGASVIGILPPVYDIELKRVREINRTSLTEKEKKDFDDVLELCDGFVLEGGVYAYMYEEYVAEYAFRNNVPILGICEGFSRLVCAAGGKLAEENVAEHNVPEKKYVHDVIVNKNSKFYQIVCKERFMVNSVHTTKIANAGDYEIVGHSDDGIPEVVENKNHKFNVGVKFHPELLTDEDENMNSIFKAFVEAAKS